MQPPVLNVPGPRTERRPRVHFRPRKLERWAEELPLADPHEAGRRLLRQLHELNHGHYGAAERLKLLATLLPVAHRIIVLLGDGLLAASLPPDPHTEARADLLQRLLEELAVGYKLIVNEYTLWDEVRASRTPELAEAVYFAAKFLALRLVFAYVLYQPEPVGTWRELKELYRYAEDSGIHDRPVDDNYHGQAAALPPTVDRVFRQVVLLALAEPYNLMQHEAWQVFLLAGAWAAELEFMPAPPGPIVRDYVLDLADTRPPRFHDDSRPARPRDGRIIDISGVRRQLELLLRPHLNPANLEGNLQLRQQRDMLLRLAATWDETRARRMERRPDGARLKLVTGLEACHHLTGRKAPFTPAMNELKLTTANGQARRLSPDAFTLAYRNALTNDRRQMFTRYTVHPMVRRDVSPRGMAVEADPGAGEAAPARVGDLVGYRFTARRTERWHLGVVRWLKAPPGHPARMGIMHLARTAVPVGVRALQGPGEGAGHFRAMLIPRQESVSQQRSLITPAGVFDVGSVLAVGTERRLFHVRLTRLLLATGSFAQFAFERLEAARD